MFCALRPSIVSVGVVYRVFGGGQRDSGGVGHEVTASGSFTVTHTLTHTHTHRCVPNGRRLVKITHTIRYLGSRPFHQGGGGVAGGGRGFRRCRTDPVSEIGVVDVDVASIDENRSTAPRHRKTELLTAPVYCGATTRKQQPPPLSPQEKKKK